MSAVMSPDAGAARAGWGWLMAFGVILAVLGVICLVNVVDASLVTAALVGLLLALGGVVEIISGFLGGGSGTRRVIHIVVGILYLIVGLWVFAEPIKGVIALTLLIAIMLIAEGILRIWWAVTEHPEWRWLHVGLGIITILLGFWLWTGIPVSGIVIGFFVGLSLLMAGITWMALAWAVRSAEKST